MQLRAKRLAIRLRAARTSRDNRKSSVPSSIYQKKKKKQKKAKKTRFGGLNSFSCVLGKKTAFSDTLSNLNRLIDVSLYPYVCTMRFY